MMNIFRFVADMAHLLSFIFLLFQLRFTKSASGISLKTQALFLVVFLARYLDLLTVFVSWYNEVMKMFYISASAYIVFLMRFDARFWGTYDKHADSYRVEFLVAPALVLALIFNEANWSHFSAWRNFQEVMWAFSLYLEAVAILPQLKMLHQLEDTTNITMHYIATLGIYRALYLVNWIYRYFAEDYWHWIAVLSGLVQTALYIDFFFLYHKSVILTLPSVTPSAGGRGGRFAWFSIVNKFLFGARRS